MPSDTAVKYDWKANNHLVVLRNGHFYEFDLVHNGQELSEAEIESQLQTILADSASSKPAAQPVGALSSNNRDKWTESRKALAALPGNQQALERIDSSVIVVCLDETAPHSIESTAWGLWCGDGKNRFYDKQQIIAFANGKSGFMGEHSMMDGTRRCVSTTLRCRRSRRARSTSARASAPICPLPSRSPSTRTRTSRPRSPRASATLSRSWAGTTWRCSTSRATARARSRSSSARPTLGCRW